MDEQGKRVLIGEILDPVTPELEAELTRTDWELIRDVEDEGPAEQDTEGIAWASRGLRPVAQDTESQLSRWGIAPVEGEDDVVGIGWTAGELGSDQYTEGQVRVRLRPEDDHSDQGASYGGIRQIGTDTESQVYIRFKKPAVP
jgi:hypothetical protein